MRKMYLAALLLSAISSVGIMSCKKNKNNDVSPNALVLDAPKVSGNLVTLSWSKLANDSLVSYVVMRITDSTTTPKTGQELVVDKSKTTITDTLPLAPYVQYVVYAQLPTRTVMSNTQTSLRTDMTFMAISPMDALYDRSTRKMYIYSSDGNLALYDVASKTVSKQIQMNATVGYCALGNYNGTAELYVPRTDGWLFIYNAATLDQIDQINIGSQLNSVTVNGDKLFITASPNYSSSILCYSRATKSKISSTSAMAGNRLKLVPGTTSEFFAVSSYEDAYYFKFDNSGNFVSQQYQSLSGSYYTTPDIFEVFPDGSKFITGISGILIDKNLTYITTLPHGNISFTSFDFDNTNSLIYAGCSTKAIQAYAMSNFQLTKTISTQGVPKRVFYDNGSILSVSTATYSAYNYYSYNVYTFVEQL